MNDTESATDRRRVSLLVGTRKGGFFIHGGGAAGAWRLDGPHFLGSMVNDLALDPRDGETVVLAAKAGHLGSTVFCGRWGSSEWTEARRPPAFAKAADGEAGRAVDHVFCVVPGHASEPGVWYAGSSPVGLFRSEDGGATWTGVSGFNDGLYPRVADRVEEVPEGSILHSIRIDPRDAAHLYVCLSTGGVFESVDRGENWQPLNRGVEANFLPGPNPEYGHDPHCLAVHPTNPDRLYQQNHCGIYRLDRPGEEWQRIGRAMPTDVGDIGFGIALHPRDPDTAWVFPMDGTDVWPRTSPDGRPAAYRTRDGGASWVRQDRGLPPEHAWFSVKRQALCTDTLEPVGVYFGTANGEIWLSADEGENWSCAVRYLPPILSVAAVTEVA